MSFSRIWRNNMERGKPAGEWEHKTMCWRLQQWRVNAFSPSMWHLGGAEELLFHNNKVSKELSFAPGSKLDSFPTVPTPQKVSVTEIILGIWKVYNGMKRRMIFLRLIQIFFWLFWCRLIHKLNLKKIKKCSILHLLGFLKIDSNIFLTISR